ncbi:uncharacterized protein N7496_003258 [Penicillium cataractarum]|uniref:Alpha/beta hydrolase fold-3 domain-containing protein n=1 Tax=Penicillium cataractarum TaxID=2100454 RepID=A0A9W9VIN4_9EURO|nr:uncharacterized protein N7496_003258 [Penicillium cataractarum]KAJ5380830.1 hypothetical protein N7496_003258 [Penicillium cataractarum]
MRSLIHTSSRLIISQPKRNRLLHITYFRARLLSTSSSWTHESFELPIGNNGSISISVTRPEASSSPTQSNSRSQGPNVILYLPPGPLFQGHADRAREDVKSHDSTLKNREWVIDPGPATGLIPQQTLASTTSATVVTVNYRLGAVSPPTSNEETIQNSGQTPPLPSSSSPSHSTSQSQSIFYKYPTPIHDTLAAFDWIQTHLQPAQLGIFGSHIGGSLALMLALTEAQSVKAVASIMPVCDWPGLDEYCTTEQLSASASGDTTDQASQGKPTKRASKKKTPCATAPADLVPLLAAREALFASPERCFDAFASPILFLRSAGRDVPRSFPEYMIGPEYPIPVLKTPQHNTLDASLSNPEFDPLAAEEDELSEAGHPTIRRRKALSRWPPYGLDYGAGGRGWGGNGVRRLQVTLPWVRVYVEGKEGNENGSVLAEQGEEMVSVMRRACFFGREKGFGERRVSLERDIGGVGAEVGGWFEGIFDGRIRDE